MSKIKALHLAEHNLIQVKRHVCTISSRRMQAEKQSALDKRAIPLQINLRRVAVDAPCPRSAADRFRRGPCTKGNGNRRSQNHQFLCHFTVPFSFALCRSAAATIAAIIISFLAISVPRLKIEN